MIVIDANLLIYAYDLASADHKKSLVWLENVLSGDRSSGIALAKHLRFPPNYHESAFGGSACGCGASCAVVEAWLQQPNVQVIVPGDQHWSVLRRMILEGRASGPLVSDAQIAALTIEYGGVLYTADRDFARFPGCGGKTR